MSARRLVCDRGGDACPTIVRGPLSELDVEGMEYLIANHGIHP
jgi:hypothetical protein